MPSEKLTPTKIAIEALKKIEKHEKDCGERWAEATTELKHIKEIEIIEFDHKDVVRHPLISKIIRAYQKKSADDKN